MTFHTPDVNLRFRPFLTDSNRFDVYCDDLLVAMVAKVPGGWQSVSAGRGGRVYKTALAAAFADANLSDPKSWNV